MVISQLPVTEGADCILAESYSNVVLLFSSCSLCVTYFNTIQWGVSMHVRFKFLSVYNSSYENTECLVSAQYRINLSSITDEAKYHGHS